MPIKLIVSTRICCGTYLKGYGNPRYVPKLIMHANVVFVLLTQINLIHFLLNSFSIIAQSGCFRLHRSCSSFEPHFSFLVLIYVYSKQPIFGLTQEWLRVLSLSRLACGVHDKLHISSGSAERRGSPMAMLRAWAVFKCLIWGYGLELRFWVVIAIIVSLTLTITLIATLTIIFP